MKSLYLDRARHTRGRQPGAGGQLGPVALARRPRLAGQGRATAGSARRTGRKRRARHRRGDRRHSPGEGGSGPADERRAVGRSDGARTPWPRSRGVLARRARGPASKGARVALKGRHLRIAKPAASEESASGRQVGRGRDSRRLFVIDGAKALRRAIGHVFESSKCGSSSAHAAPLPLAAEVNRGAWRTAAPPTAHQARTTPSATLALWRRRPVEPTDTEIGPHPSRIVDRYRVGQRRTATRCE